MPALLQRNRALENATCFMEPFPMFDGDDSSKSYDFSERERLETRHSTVEKKIVALLRIKCNRRRKFSPTHGRRRCYVCGAVGSRTSSTWLCEWKDTGCRLAGLNFFPRYPAIKKREKRKEITDGKSSLGSTVCFMRHLRRSILCIARVQSRCPPWIKTGTDSAQANVFVLCRVYLWTLYRTVFRFLDHNWCE